jgi:hypothetical protein
VTKRKPATAAPPKFLSRVLSVITHVQARLFGQRRKPKPRPRRAARAPRRTDFYPNLEDFVACTEEEAAAWLAAMLQAIRDLAAEMIAAGALNGIDIAAAVEAERRQLNQPPASPKAALQISTAAPPQPHRPTPAPAQPAAAPQPPASRQAAKPPQPKRATPRPRQTPPAAPNPPRPRNPPPDPVSAPLQKNR